MKLIHMADLHLGIRVNECSMIEDQIYIFDEIIKIIDKEKPDAVLLAGDIYDKPIPPVDAINLFDSFLSRLSERSIPVLVISGNHDSPERLTFGANLMTLSKVYMAPVYDGNIRCVTLKDSEGPVNFYLLPYIKPSSVRQVFPEEKVNTFSDAVGLALSQIKLNKDERNVLLAHQFVTGAKTCESEELYVGGSENVNASLFDAFDYVALGHIHGPQSVCREEVRYCGTPLKYSFSEVNHKKGLALVELGPKGHVKYTSIPLKPLREMRELRGTFQELMFQNPLQEQHTDDYLHITLTDEMDIPEGFGRLSSVYKNLLKLDYDNSRTRSNREIQGIENARNLDPLELFGDFFEMQNNHKVSDEQKEFLKNLIDDIWEAK